MLDRQLEDKGFVVGDAMTIADFAIWPWTSRYEWQRIDMNDFPNVKRWYEAMDARPGVQRGLAAQVPG